MSISLEVCPEVINPLVPMVSYLIQGFPKIFSRARRIKIVLAPGVSEAPHLADHMAAKFRMNNSLASHQVAVKKVSSRVGVKPVAG